MKFVLRVGHNSYHVFNSRCDQSHQEAVHGGVIFKILERQWEVALDGAI